MKHSAKRREGEERAASSSRLILTETVGCFVLVAGDDPPRGLLKIPLYDWHEFISLGCCCRLTKLIIFLLLESNQVFRIGLSVVISHINGRV